MPGIPRACVVRFGADDTEACLTAQTIGGAPVGSCDVVDVLLKVKNSRAKEFDPADEQFERAPRRSAAADSRGRLL